SAVRLRLDERRNTPAGRRSVAACTAGPSRSSTCTAGGPIAVWRSGGEGGLPVHHTVVTGQDGNGNDHTGVAGWSVTGYTELKTLGSGGFGDVVLARHDASGTLVAVKYLQRKLLADPQWAGLFRAEAQVLAYLDDPNIVQMYEYAESPWGAAI